MLGGKRISEFHKLVHHVDSLSDIKGIIYRDGLELIQTAERPLIESLDVLPWIDYEGFGFGEYLDRQSKVKMYYDPVNHFHRRTLPIPSSRSCPNNCTFCFHSLGKKYRVRDNDDFISNIEYMIKRYGIEFVCIVDDLFTHKIENVERFSKAMEEHNVKWSIYTRVNLVTERLAQILSSSNCQGVCLGIESANNDILKSMKKNITIEQTERAIDILCGHNIRTFGNVIIGDKAETYETALESLNWVKMINKRYNHLHVTIIFLMAFPGSEIYKYACDKGFIKDKQEFFESCIPQINISKMSDAEFSSIAKLMSDCNQSSHALAECSISSIDHNTFNVDVNADCPYCNSSKKFIHAHWRSLIVLK